MTFKLTRTQIVQLRMVAAVVAIAAGFVFGMWMPHQDKVTKLRKEIEGAKQELDGVRESSRQHMELAKQVSVMEKAVAANTKRLPRASEADKLYGELDREVGKQGLTDYELLPQAEVSGTDFSYIPLSLHFRGSFASVYAFLKRLETLPRTVIIDQLVIRGDPKQSDSISASVELCTFYIPSEAPAP